MRGGPATLRQRSDISSSKNNLKVKAISHYSWKNKEDLMAKKATKANEAGASSSSAKYPRHTVEKALRIPRAIIDQNAGKECTDKDSAKFSGVGFNGPYKVELSSSIKYGFLTRPKPGHVAVTDRGRQALRPQKPGDEIDALRHAILEAPDISTVYKHYRGENLPDGSFFENALVDKFAIFQRALDA